MSYTCKYCNKTFSKESILAVHACEPKRRAQQQSDPAVQIGFRAYLRFYETTQGSAKLKTYEDFKDEFKKVAMAVQGSGWVYLSTQGTIKSIPNHQVRTDICVLVDWWEHAWSLDYQWDKEAYLDNIWKIINWEVCNERL